MADEAIMLYRKGLPSDFIISDTTTILKGSLMKLTDPMTCALSAATGEAIAGVLARDKVASDGRTRAACYQSGIFEFLASGAITIGAPVIAATSTASNVIKMAAGIAVSSGAQVVGYAKETASDGERIAVELAIGGSV